MAVQLKILKTKTVLVVSRDGGLNYCGIFGITYSGSHQVTEKRIIRQLRSQVMEVAVKNSKQSWVMHNQHYQKGGDYS